MDLEELAQRAARGDSAALDQLLRGSEPLIAAKARKVLPNPLDAEEAVQDTLLAVSRNLDKFEGRSKYTTWLYQVTTNACIDRYRKLKRRQSELIDPPRHVAAAGSTPSVRAGARIDLLDAAESLDRRLVEPVLMRDLLELGYDEIATLTEAPEGTVRSRVSEGRQQLRRLLAEQI